MERTCMWTAVLFLGLTFAAQDLWAAGSTPSNPTCPVMPGEKTKKKFFADYHGRRIYLCCLNCVKKFNRNPQEYAEKLK